MGTFSCIFAADEEKYVLQYKMLNILGRNIKSKLVPHMPAYISGSVSDMGNAGSIVSGCRIYIPCGSDDILTRKRLLRAAGRSKSMGSDVLVLEGKASDYSVYKSMTEKVRMRISRGILYRPIAFIDAAKQVSGLLGIDFRRSNICIADASTEMGRIMTELLINDASFLILCTHNKDSINENTENYIRNCGLSPAVVSSCKKAMESCDILVYTGGIDINALVSFSSKRLLILNLSTENAKPEKDFLVVDEVILKGPREPVIGKYNSNPWEFLTSRAWEGAMAAAWGIDVGTFSYDKALIAARHAKKMGIEVRMVMKEGKFLDKDSIYCYR